MKYLSLFSGIGGFELGIAQAYETIKNWEQESIAEGSIGKHIQRQRIVPNNRSRRRKSKQEKRYWMEQWVCIGYSEIDKYAIQIYQQHFPEHKNYGDITKINAEELPDFDFLCGGFPCQSFSIAGKRGGFNDTRGTLFFDIARILKVKRPRLFLLENVKGLLSHDEGRTFATIISTLDELGYDLQWEVLNSKNFGVPQNRERVFIIGHIRGTSRPKVFPFGEVGKRVDVWQSEFSGQIQTEKERPDSGHIDSEILQNGENGYIHQINKPNHSNNRVYGEKGISPTLNTMQGGLRQPFVSVAPRNKNRSKHQNKEGLKYGDFEKEYQLEENKEGISFTVKSATQEFMALDKENMKIRRLTPKECERLQGFPDDWTSMVSDTQRYKCCGNAVTVNVIKAIVEKLFK